MNNEQHQRQQEYHNIQQHETAGATTKTTEVKQKTIRVEAAAAEKESIRTAPSIARATQ